VRDNYRAAAERVQTVQAHAGGGEWSASRLPGGQVHAMDATTGEAACGYTGTLYDFGAWRDEILRYCRACTRLVPLEE